MTLLRNRALLNNPILRGGAASDPTRWTQELNRQTVAAGGLPNSSKAWTTTTAFSSTDANTVEWTSGALQTADGVTYSINSGNTGNMAARTWIYFDPNTSETAYQTSTTNTDAIGEDKILIAVAENTSTEAFFQVFNGTGGMLITANEIAANSITANRLAASLTFTNELIISSGGQIRQGQTDYDTGTGFWLGDDGGTPKFSIGDSSGSKLTWDGSDLAIDGNIVGASETGTDSGTLSGFTTTVNVTWDYQRTGNIVVLKLSGGAATGTSNAAQMVYTTLAAGLRPSGNRSCFVSEVQDDGVSLWGLATVTSSGGIAFLRSSVRSATGTDGVGSANFTTSGTKGLGAGIDLVYAL